MLTFLDYFSFNKPNPDLIHILEYNYLIYGQRCSKMTMTKPRGIPDGEWTKKEMVMMKINRQDAQDLYDEIKAL